MELTNYWWLLLWLFTGGVILNVYFPKRKEIVLGKTEERWNILSAILLVLPYIIWAGFRSDNFGDTYIYRKNFLEAPDTVGQVLRYVNGAIKDKGFAALVAICKCIIGNQDVLYFLIIATFQLLVISLVLRKLSCNYWLSIFIFIASTDYLSWMHNGVRQFTAVAIAFGATELIVRKKYVAATIIILIASTIHGSALLMLPIMLIIQGKAWNKKTMLLILASFLALVFVDQFTNILDTLLSDTQYTNVVSDWKSWEDDGTNPIRILVYAVPTILSLIGYKYIKEADEPLINIAVNASIVSTGLGIISTGTSGIFLGRLPIYVST